MEKQTIIFLTKLTLFLAVVILPLHTQADPLQPSH